MGGNDPEQNIRNGVLGILSGSGGRHVSVPSYEADSLASAWGSQPTKKCWVRDEAGETCVVAMEPPGAHSGKEQESLKSAWVLFWVAASVCCCICCCAPMCWWSDSSHEYEG